MNRSPGDLGGGIKWEDIDWTTDACTGVDDRLFGFDCMYLWNGGGDNGLMCRTVKPACVRHDFAVRNYMRENRLTKV
jgi:hypothetical protein